MTVPLHRKISDAIISRIKQIEKGDEFDLAQVKRGILSIHAHWSGPSKLNRASILGLLDQSESKDFEIFIVDIDAISPQKQIEWLGDVSHGYFESVWIENGRIECIYGHNRTTELAKFKDYLNEKLNKSS